MAVFCAHAGLTRAHCHRATLTLSPSCPVVTRSAAAVFGDFGISNDVIMASLANDSAKGLFDFVHHVGE